MLTRRYGRSLMNTQYALKTLNQLRPV
ncbi:XRE family transcriptional regulator, partial [Salmonella enterica subsp. enterica serovar London]|nr:XRE family transcriptional regulator [Salmonella enterica subsp. enterica serovar London]